MRARRFRSRGGVDVTLIVHRFERDRFERFIEAGFVGPALILALLAQLRERGSVRNVHLSSGLEPRQTDVAILHVNATVVSSEYTEFASTFRRCINRGVVDISKRSISTLLAGPESVGPVIVKADLNFYGRPEHRLNEQARQEGHPEPFPTAVEESEYVVYPSHGDVPAEARDDPRLVIQRFVPERVNTDYALRHWVFCGDQGYCHRYVSPKPIIKGRNVTGKEPVPIPEELLSWRRKHGFDFGKVDFVVHDDQVSVLDANKTPGRIPASTGESKRRLTMLADGLESLIIGSRP